MAFTTHHLQQWKHQQRPIVVLTAWDWAIAQIIDQAGVDVVLVGDSLAMVALGYKNTLPLTLEEILHHTKAVVRGVNQALVVADLPFLSYQASIPQAIHSAGLLLKEGGAAAVKLEGGHPAMVETIAKLTAIGIPVMGHLGLTPQSIHQLGYRQQGKTVAAQTLMMEQAIALQEAGIFALVLEHIPSELALQISQKLVVPTIGIGAGKYCDGQVLVTADLLGLTERMPPFAKAYANLRQTITQAVQDYIQEVQIGKFPE